jgi:hypothetical protein
MLQPHITGGGTLLAVETVMKERRLLFATTLLRAPDPVRIGPATIGA